MYIYIYQNTWCHISEDDILHSHCGKNLKSRSCLVFHSGVVEVSVFVGCDADSLGTSLPVFEDEVVVPSSRVELSVLGDITLRLWVLGFRSFERT